MKEKNTQKIYLMLEILMFFMGWGSSDKDSLTSTDYLILCIKWMLFRPKFFTLETCIIFFSWYVQILYKIWSLNINSRFPLTNYIRQWNHDTAILPSNKKYSWETYSPVKYILVLLMTERIKYCFKLQQKWNKWLINKLVFVLPW